MINLFKKKIKKVEQKTTTYRKQEVVAEVKKLRVSFDDPLRPKEKNLVIRDVSFKLYKSEILAIIGESGSGKSVITSALYGLLGDNANIESGEIIVLGNNVENFRQKDWFGSKLRGTGISAVFQDSMSMLNPTMKISKQIMEGMLINKLVDNKKDAYKNALTYLRMTKIDNPEKVMEMYPHELSGGMNQRVAIASIIALQPKIIILDEPTTSLDPTTQALVLDIIYELKTKLDISIIFIAHDLGVVSSVADRISIMYGGQIIEEGKRDEIMWYPRHPYTWGLLLSMPDLNDDSKLNTIKGMAPSSLNNIVGDAFAPRNDWAMGIDFKKEPPKYKISPTHFARTRLLDEKAPKYDVPDVISKRWIQFKKMKG